LHISRTARRAVSTAARTDAVNILLRTNDVVLISAVEAILKGAGIEYLVADTHASVVEGSAGAIPRRILVAAESLVRARDLLTAAGFGHMLAKA
jgi:hypothetical protein